MKIEDFYKPGKNIIDAEKFFKEDGTVDDEKLSFLQEQKPIVTSPKDNNRFKFFSIKENRDRYEIFPERLPTRGLLPQPVDAHEMIGQIETQQNIYLTIANAYNKAMERIELLEKELLDLKNSIK